MQSEVGNLGQDDLSFIVDTFAGVCLRHLINQEFIAESEVQGKWRSSEASLILEARALATAVSIDVAGMPVLLYNKDMPLKDVINSLPHEAIHLAQICKGDYEPFKGYSIWRGAKHKSLHPNDPHYYSEQPWEEEANRLERGVRVAMYGKMQQH